MIGDGKQGKRAGRPTVKTRRGEKSTLGIRAAASLKERLDREAKKHGRSLSEEAALRLENSFRDGDALNEALVMAFGIRGAALVLIVGETAKWLAVHLHGKDPLIDQSAFGELSAAIKRCLEFLDPASPAYSHTENITGELVATEVLAQIAKTQGPTADWAKSIREKLGDASDRLTARAKLMEGP